MNKKSLIKLSVFIIVAIVLLAVVFVFEDKPRMQDEGITVGTETTDINTKVEITPTPAPEATPEAIGETPEAEENKAPEETTVPEKKETVAADATREKGTAPEKEEGGREEAVEANKDEPDIDDSSKNEMYCTFSIRCDTLLKNTDKLKASVLELVPEDGIILKPVKAKLNEGESVFNVLLRETRRNNIHMEYVSTPMYNSAYIEGIANLYEFECTNLSGWMYKVNGEFPPYGCSLAKLSDGDVVEWVYTCDYGTDVGATVPGGGQLSERD